VASSTVSPPPDPSTSTVVEIETLTETSVQTKTVSPSTESVWLHDFFCYLDPFFPHPTLAAANIHSSTEHTDHAENLDKV